MTQITTNSQPTLSRRRMMGAALAAGATTSLFATTACARAGHSGSMHKFSMDYAPHYNSFKASAGKDYVDQLSFAHEQGFTAWEDNGLPKRDKALQDRIAKAMERLDIRMGVFVAHKVDWKAPSLTTGKQEHVDAFLADMKNSVELAKRFNAKWMTVVPGVVNPGMYREYQTGHIIDALRRAADILEPHDMTMVLEPLNHYANHPGVHLATVPEAYMLCRAVNSPACKILYDMYHQQIQQGNIIPNIDEAWDEIGYFQIGDTPGRIEPGAGEMNYLNIFKHIYDKGFKGVLGMEHKASMPGKAGEMALIEAYRKNDSFTR